MTTKETSETIYETTYECKEVADGLEITVKIPLRDPVFTKDRAKGHAMWDWKAAANYLQLAHGKDRYIRTDDCQHCGDGECFRCSRAIKPVLMDGQISFTTCHFGAGISEATVPYIVDAVTEDQGEDFLIQLAEEA